MHGRYDVIGVSLALGVKSRHEAEMNFMYPDKQQVPRLISSFEEPLQHAAGQGAERHERGVRHHDLWPVDDAVRPWTLLMLEGTQNTCADGMSSTTTSTLTLTSSRKRRAKPV